MINRDKLSIYLRENRIPVFSGCHYINKDYSSLHARLPHKHIDFLELLYVYEGNGSYMVNDKYYEVKAGDIIVCNAETIHGENPDELCNMTTYCIAISNVAFVGLKDNSICDDEKTTPVVSCGFLAGQVGEIFRLVHTLSFDPSHMSDICSCLSCSVLLLTFEILKSRKRNTHSHNRISAAATADRIRKYLDNNYRSAVSLDKIAEDLKLNKYYLSHVFKDEFGVSPIQYSMKRRIGEAQNLLMESSMPIGEIADELGFSSVCHLNSMFSQYVGMPPGKYRHSFRKMKE